MTDMAHRSQFPTSIDYHSNSQPWRVLLPPVYRYLPQDYVSSFFENGELMLASVKQFHKHQDEARGDLDEGKAILRLRGPSKEFWALTASGQNSYILSTSLRLDSETMGKFEGCDAAFEIFDVPNFALEVARQLAGFRNGTSGHCIYRGYAISRRTAEDAVLGDGSGQEITFEDMVRLVGDAAGAEHLLLKAPRFAYQEEYRLIWNTDAEVGSNIIVKAPFARQYCRRLEPNEI